MSEQSSPRFSKITRSSDGDEYCLVYLIYKKTTRRFKHCEEAWRVLVLQRYVKIMIQQNILLIFISKTSFFFIFFIYINLLYYLYDLMIKMINPVVPELKAENLICQTNLPACPALQLQPQFQDPARKSLSVGDNQSIMPSVGLPLPF